MYGARLSEEAQKRTGETAPAQGMVLHHVAYALYSLCHRSIFMERQNKSLNEINGTEF